MSPLTRVLLYIVLSVFVTITTVISQFLLVYNKEREYDTRLRTVILTMTSQQIRIITLY